MRHTIKTLMLTASLLALPVTAHAHTNHCKDTQLGDQMKSLKENFKTYRQALSEENWQQMAQARAEMQSLATAAGDEQPLKMHDLPADQHPQMMQEYQQGLAKLNDLFDQLAQAEQAQNADAAADLVGLIGQHSKQSHESMRKDCD